MALERSFLLYARRMFVYPRRRETFDGKPVSFPAVDTDLDWVEPSRDAAA